VTDIRFYLDEHIAQSVVAGLERRGVDAITTDEAGIRGASDEEQLAHATQQQRVIVTKDDDFLRLHAQGVQHNGIVFVPGQASIGAIIRGLNLIHLVLNTDEMRNHVEFL
jgi:predicted homoserine dehydrogenase-like protein